MTSHPHFSSTLGSATMNTSSERVFMLPFVFGASLASLGASYYGFGDAAEAISAPCLFVLISYGFLFGRGSPKSKMLLLATILACGAFSSAYALVFYINANTSEYAPYLLSNRWIVYWCLFPCLKILRESGYSTKAIAITIALAVIFILLLFVYRQLTWDLAAMAAQLGREGQRLAIRAPDALRGYRLIDPQYVEMAALILLLTYTFTAHDKKQASVSIVGVGVIGAALWQSFSRVSLVYCALSLPMAWVISRFRGKGAAMTAVSGCAYIIICTILVLSLGAYSGDAQDRSAMIRLDTLSVIRREVGDHFLLGYGTDSARALSYQRIFGKTFFPQDVGFAGIMFQYGLFGILIVCAIYYKFISCAVKIGGLHDRRPTFSRFACIWASLYFLVGGFSFYPLFSSDGIYTLAVLAYFIDSEFAKDDEIKRARAAAQQF